MVSRPAKRVSGVLRLYESRDLRFVLAFIEEINNGL
jgi:hypothetical protein